MKNCRCIAWCLALMCFSSTCLVHGAAATRPATLPPLREVGRLEGQTGGMLLFSPDGSRILTANGSSITVDSSGELQLWDARTFEPLGAPLEHANLKRAHFDASGKKLLTIAGTDDGPQDNARITSGDAKLWDVATGKLLIPPIRHGDLPLTDAAISPDGTLVATCMRQDSIVYVWDAATGKRNMALAHKENIWSVQFDPTGSTLVSVGNTLITLRDTKSGKARATLPDFGESPMTSSPPSISADGKRLAVGGFYYFAVYDLVTGRKVALFRPELHLDDYVAGVSISADGTRVATSSSASTTDCGMVWDVATLEPLMTVPEAYSGVPVFSPDGTKVIFDIYRGQAMWDIRSRRPFDWSDELDRSLVSFSPDGHRLAVHSFRGYTSILAIDNR